MTSKRSALQPIAKSIRRLDVQRARTLHGWAIGTLIETHAIIECADHGHIRDRGSWAHGWDEAKAIARSHPFDGATPRQCIDAIDDVMASVGNVCPEC